MASIAEPVLVGVAGDDGDAAAVETALEVARAMRAPVRVVSVWTVPAPLSAFGSLGHVAGLEEDARAVAKIAADRAVARVEAAGVAASAAVRTGEPARELRAEAEESGARVLVVGRPARPRSVATELASSAPCPVLVAGNRYRLERFLVREAAAAAER